MSIESQAHAAHQLDVLAQAVDPLAHLGGPLHQAHLQTLDHAVCRVTLLRNLTAEGHYPIPGLLPRLQDVQRNLLRAEELADLDTPQAAVRRACLLMACADLLIAVSLLRRPQEGRQAG